MGGAWSPPLKELPTIQVNGIDLYYVESGAGDPLVLGGGMANILSKYVPGMQATAEVTGGSVDNLKLIGAGMHNYASANNGKLPAASSGRLAPSQATTAPSGG